MSNTQKPISAYFQADHDRLDHLFHQYCEKKRTDVRAAKPYFLAFLKGLQRHVVWEEEVLFPFFEKVRGEAVGPIEVMRQEHRKIGAILNRIHNKVKVADPNTDDDKEELLAVLKPHNDKEEKILYPVIDQHAGAGQAAELFLQMEDER